MSPENTAPVFRFFVQPRRRAIMLPPMTSSGKCFWPMKAAGSISNVFAAFTPTAPFVTAQKLKTAMELLDKAESVMPVVPFSYPPQRGIILENGRVRRKYPEFLTTRSQDLETMYHDCGQFYACRTDAFFRDSTTDVDDLLPMIMPEMEVQDIDTEEDWAIAELKFLHMKDGNPAP